MAVAPPIHATQAIRSEVLVGWLLEQIVRLPRLQVSPLRLYAATRRLR